MVIQTTVITLGLSLRNSVFQVALCLHLIHNCKYTFKPQILKISELNVHKTKL
jgi:hypothetical protein